MKISVVIATYNGEKYILDQLTSLLDQCRQPEQVLIFDDCSTDNTPSLIKSFIEKNKLSGWNLIENEQNKGWRCNFWNGILISTGDIVFLCDQDDIWRRDKIQKMSEAMEDNSKIELLASGYTKLFDETGELDPMPEHMDIVQQTIYNNIFYVLLPGCTYCVRRSLIDQVAPYWEPETAHDEILWRFSLFSESLYVYRENFIKWRKHKNSAWSIQGRNAKNIKAKIEWIRFANNQLRQLKEYLNKNRILTKDKESILLGNSKWLSNRYRFYKTKKFIYAIKLLFQVKYYNSFKQYLGDLYIVYFVK